MIPHQEFVKRRHRERHLDRDPEPYYYNYNTSTLEVGGLYQGYGTHYVDLWVGTPPQRQTVIVDTGSGVTAFPCTGCADCGSKYHVDAYFDPTMSSTYHKLECDECQNTRCTGSGHTAYCHLSVSYQEGSSWDAKQAKDMTYVGGLHDSSVSTPNKDEGSELHGLVHGEDPMNAGDYTFDMVFGCQNHITGLFKTQLVSFISTYNTSL